MTDADLAAARAVVHDATPEGWFVGKHEREWTAATPTEVFCGNEMALPT
jgi:hypothetical protein